MWSKLVKYVIFTFILRRCQVLTASYTFILGSYYVPLARTRPIKFLPRSRYVKEDGITTSAPFLLRPFYVLTGPESVIRPRPHYAFLIMFKVRPHPSRP